MEKNTWEGTHLYMFLGGGGSSNKIMHFLDKSGQSIPSSV